MATVSATSAPEPRTPLLRRPVVAAAIVAVAGAGIVAGIAATSHHATVRYAGTGDDALLHGSVAHPALQSQGLPVEVALPHGSARITVIGPETPGQGLPVQQTYDTVTFTIRVTDATTSVPLSLADFDTLDHGGEVGHLSIVPDTPAPPATLAKGGSTTFQVREQMVVGEGLMRYAPDGAHIEAKWDFEVEND